MSDTERILRSLVNEETGYLDEKKVHDYMAKLSEKYSSIVEMAKAIGLKVSTFTWMYSSVITGEKITVEQVLERDGGN